MANLGYLQLTRDCKQHCRFCSNPPSGVELTLEELRFHVDGLVTRGYDGIYEAAAGLIDSSPWEIRGMPKRPVPGGSLGLGGTALPGLAGDLMGDVFKFKN